jgi:hypothetical protein
MSTERDKEKLRLKLLAGQKTLCDLCRKLIKTNKAQNYYG